MLVAAAACFLAAQLQAAAAAAEDAAAGGAAALILGATRELGAEVEPGQDVVVNATVRPGARDVELVYK
jgi:hypothetical protein